MAMSPRARGPRRRCCAGRSGRRRSGTRCGVFLRSGGILGGFQPLPPPLFYCCGLTAPRRGFCIGSPQLWDPRFGVFPYSLTAPLCSYGMRAALQNQRPALSTAPKPSDCSATASSAASCESRPPKAPKRPHRPHKPPSAPPQTTPRPPPPGAKHPQAAAIPPSLGARLFVHEVEQSEPGSNYIPSLKTRRGFVPLSRANPTEPHFDLPPPPLFFFPPSLHLSLLPPHKDAPQPFGFRLG